MYFTFGILIGILAVVLWFHFKLNNAYDNLKADIVTHIDGLLDRVRIELNTVKNEAKALDLTGRLTNLENRVKLLEDWKNHNPG